MILAAWQRGFEAHLLKNLLLGQIISSNFSSADPSCYAVEGTIEKAWCSICFVSWI